MKNSSFLTRIGIGGLCGLLLMLVGCTSVTVPKNKYHAHSRSPYIENDMAEQAILSKAKLELTNDPELNNIRILQMSGTPYEMGYQHGRLLKEDVQANLGRIYKRVAYFIDPEVLDEAYALMEPYIPIEDKMELLGLAHGADLPIKMVQRLHAIPEMSEYKHKKKYSKKKMLATSCSNVAAFGAATKDGEVYSMRILDWVRELGTQNYAAVLIYKPNEGNNYVNFSYAGFVGCITGMNDQGLTFGEMGYGNLPDETLEGIPFVFLFKKLLRESKTLQEAIDITKNAQRTCSYGYLFADGINKDASLIICNKDEFFEFKQNETLKDEESLFPAIQEIVYGGAKDADLHRELDNNHGNIDAEALKAMARPTSLKSNMQIVIMKPVTFEAWIANAADSSLLDARSEEGRACNQKYFHINFKDYLF